MKCAVVTTTTPDVVSALDGLCDRLAADLDDLTPDLLIAHYTPHHSGDAPVIHRKLTERLGPRVLLGCPASGIIGEEVEIESQTGLALWAAHWPGVELAPFRLDVEIDEESQTPRISGWPETVPEDAGFLLLVDPYTTPADELMENLRERYPGAPVMGGMVSGTQGPGDAQLMTEGKLFDSGAVGVAVGGAIRIDPVVSQGCRPVGKHFVITKAEQNVIYTLGGKPALTQLRTVVESVEEPDRQLIQRALHVGRVVNERKSTFEQGDFLVRNVLGLDPKSEAMAITDLVRAGQTIQFMVRDAEAATAELKMLLDREAHKGPTLGALLFTCNGRGQRFFGEPHHDIRAVREGLGEVPTAGIFAAGEIGPVGGESFLHGFTASIALFRERSATAGD